MAIFVIGDLHLSLGAQKPMDVFPGWQGYLARLEANWRALIAPGDTVVLAGDTSWAMKLEDTAADFAFLQSLPGKKLLIKGNHDYWWNSAAKMRAFFARQGFDSLDILHNNSYEAEGLALCGTRSWMLDAADPQDEKVRAREQGRLRASLAAAAPGCERLAFLHYPPLGPGGTAAGVVALLKGCAAAFTATCTGPPSAPRGRALWTASSTGWSRRTGWASARCASRPTRPPERAAAKRRRQNKAIGPDPLNLGSPQGAPPAFCSQHGNKPSHPRARPAGLKPRPLRIPPQRRPIA